MLGAGTVIAIIGAIGGLLLSQGQMTTRGVGDLVVVLLSVLALACTSAAAVATTGRQRRAWAWQGIGLAAWLVSGLILFSYTTIGGAEAAPFPSAADAVYLLYPIGACAALVYFPPSNIRLRTRLILDGVIVAVASFEVIWQLLLKDAYEAGPHNPMRFAVTVAYPMTDLMILAVAILVLPRVSGSQRVAVGLLTVGAAFNTVGDSANMYLGAIGQRVAADQYSSIMLLVYLCWAITTVFLVGAALVARRAPAVDDVDQVVSSKLDFWVPYSALAIAAMMCAPTLARGPLLTTSIVLLVAVVIRHAMVVLDNRRLESVVTDQTLRDPLTGLANRALFRDRVMHAIHLRQRDNRAVAVALLDLDNFRKVNAEFGHAVGDELLVLVAKRLMASVRAGDTVARTGADEFAILMEGVPDRARIVAQRVIHAFDEPFAVGGQLLVVRPSVGFAMAASEVDEASAADLLSRSEIAMREAKASNYYGLHSFSNTVSSELAVRGSGSSGEPTLLRELRKAIDDVELTVMYQPKVDLRTGRPFGVEALVRWPHRERGLLGPDYFLPLVRQYGLMDGVTELVLSRTLDDAVVWKRKGIDVAVAVNLSAPSVSDVLLPARMNDELTTRELEPTMLTVEITEDLLLENIVRARSVLDRLRGNGIRIALDDFGSGYSALWYLRDLAFDEVKLDRKFVTPLMTDPRAAVIVRAVIDLVHDLGGSVVAEGVEDGRVRDAV